MKELKENILYTYISQADYDKGECNSGVYFTTYEEARKSAENHNQELKPFYIVELVECHTVCGIVE